MSISFGSRITRAAGSAAAELRWRYAERQLRHPPGALPVPPTIVRDGLPMSEWIVIAGLTMALIFSLAGDFLPFKGIFLVKHLPVVVFMTGIALSYTAFALRSRSTPAKSRSTVTPAGLLWPLLLLAIVVLAGSTYAQVVEGTTNTFRNLGLNMLTAYFVARLVTLARDPVRIVTTYFTILAAAGIMTVIAMAFFFVLQGPGVAPFHEFEFLVIPLVVYVATLRDELTLRQAVLVWGGLATAVIFRKNTGYLVAVGTLAYLWWFHWRTTTRRANALRRALALLIGITFVAGLIGTYSFLRAKNRDYIPTGSTEFRMYTYERAWQKFRDSPVWGDAFTGPASERFELYDTGVADNILPTHSDLLDMLAHGGLIGFALFVWAQVQVIVAANRFVLHLPRVEIGSAPYGEKTADDVDDSDRQVNQEARISHHVVPMTHTLVCMALLAIVTVAFNPLLVNPIKSLLIWSQFGFIAGLACHFSAIDERTQAHRE